MLAPVQQEHVLEAVIKNDENFEPQFLEDVAASYMSSVDLGTQRQILPIVVKNVSYCKMKNLIPNSSPYKFGAARKHASSIGQGQQMHVMKHSEVADHCYRYSMLCQMDWRIILPCVTISIQIPAGSVQNLTDL